MGKKWVVTFYSSNSSYYHCILTGQPWCPVVLSMKFQALNAFAFQDHSRSEIEFMYPIHCYWCWKNGRLILITPGSSWNLIFNKHIREKKRKRKNYYCHIWSRATQSSFSRFHRIQNRFYGRDLIPRSLVCFPRRNVASLRVFYRLNVHWSTFLCSRGLDFYS